MQHFHFIFWNVANDGAKKGITNTHVYLNEHTAQTSAEVHYISYKANYNYYRLILILKEHIVYF